MLLIIAYAFPPLPYSGTYRTLRACKGFAELQIETHVLTINQYRDIPNDFDLLSQVPPAISVHRTPIIDPWRRYTAGKQRRAGLRGFKYINKIASYLLWFITILDHMVLWIPFAFLKARAHIKELHIDTVYVSSPPILHRWLVCYSRKSAR